MTDKILVIIASGDKEVIKTALNYALNARKNNWIEEIETVLFGPSEKTVAEDQELQQLIQKINEEGLQPIACKAVADRQNLTENLLQIGINVQYVGKYITDKIRNGYQPMTW